jgi:hypothetical protein
VARATAAAPTDDTLLVPLGTGSLTISNLERQGRALIDAERAKLDEICAALV